LIACLISLLLGINVYASPTKYFAFRIQPGQDLRQSLQKFVNEHKLQAAFVQTSVGSLTQVKLRFANQTKETILKGHFEIVSLAGTLSKEGGSHLHISVADETGKTLGGHLLDGSLVYTTAEVVLGELMDLKFTRTTDPKTTFKELSIKDRTEGSR